MRISTQYKFIFFSNPKTGSESVRKILDPYSDIKDSKAVKGSPFDSHVAPYEVKAFFQEKGWAYDDYFKFVFVRNPWAKMVSLYQMLYSGKPTKMLVTGSWSDQLKDKLKKFKQRYFDKKPLFQEWLLSLERQNPNEPIELWAKYSIYPLNKYITDEQGKMLVDKVIRLEDINRDLIPTLVHIGIPNAASMVIEQINQRSYNRYTTYYDEASVAFVAKRFKYDIDNFNYQFGE
jgi:hypothetical protein